MFPGDSSNLVLTGFMGTGKTAAGRAIAARLGRPFVDMDAEIEARAGRSIAAIFASQGEAAFRRLEAGLCRELAARQGLVIATGGGALLNADSREILAASGPVVCLQAAPGEMLRRLEGSAARPLLAGGAAEAIPRLLAQRGAAYAAIPLQVDTTGLSVDDAAGRILALVRDHAPAAVTIPVAGMGEGYSIRLGRGLLSQIGPLLHETGASGGVAVVSNPTVLALHGERLLAGLRAAGFVLAVCQVPDGEAAKTLDTVRHLYVAFVDAGLDRQGAVLAFGGGVVGDLAGLAAATYLRGVPLVQVPTTLLAMVDSSVGGKVGVDLPQGKNLVGAFKEPALVVADVEALASLPPAELANGLAEAVKTGIIGDPLLFRQIEEHGPAPLPWIVRRAVAVKAAVVEADPYERGVRATLNLGHTFGHALERLSGYALPHGAAVAVGLVASARLAARLGLSDPALAPRVAAVLGRLGLPTAYRCHRPEEIWEAMGTDKKRRGGRLRFVLPRAVGEVVVSDAVPREDVLAVLETMREEGE
jgi:shikimate kinase / 3-dehydroquinate synthase